MAETINSDEGFTPVQAPKPSVNQKEMTPAPMPDMLPKDVKPGEPVMKVDPSKAVIELRQLVKELYHKEIEKPGDSDASLTMKARYTRDWVVEVQSQTSHMKVYIDRALDQRAEAVVAALDRVTVSTKNQKTQQELINLRYAMDAVWAELHRIRQSNNYAIQYGATAKDHANKVIESIAPNSAPEKPWWKKHIDRMHILVQALPTFEGAYLTPAENVLHAIVTIAANNGYTSQGPKPIAKKDA